MKGSDMKMQNSFWEFDEFEDLVVKSLVGLYDNKTNIIKYFKAIKLKCGYSEFKKEAMPTEQDIFFARSIGPYFPPHDRVVLSGCQIDIANDGLPGMASLGLDGKIVDKCEKIEGDIEHDSYIYMVFLKKITKLPPTIIHRCINPVAYYRALRWYPENSGCEAHISRSYAAVSNTGHIYDADTVNSMAPKRDKYRNRELINCVIGFYQDRRHMWNVEAIEKEARCTFGVYEEQIKSLCYMRSLPITITGKKRPILHWVKAHQRRIREGVEIDVKKHLRGVTEFEMNGTCFRITNPLKTFNKQTIT